jgi:hypothetical protein
MLRLELVVFCLIAVLALASLIDLVRRAATDAAGGGSGEERPPSIELAMMRARIEQLELRRARSTSEGPRLVLALAALLTLAALALAKGAVSPELAWVLFAAGAGLAIPGALWARDASRRTREVDSLVRSLRARVAELEPGMLPRLEGRSDAERSVGARDRALVSGGAALPPPRS